MTKRQMMMNLINELGHEDTITVAFCNYAETHTLAETRGAYARAKRLAALREEWD
jgi:hypothetical protein